ncbi:YraN family protein [Paenibacillus sp.]|uniref:YraN family protein n=1 Tax=Paenibacillus sp. TaxID=58172 RepID=UPI0028120A2A|nr:YraN family protein [Paenibacillus sp.]
MSGGRKKATGAAGEAAAAAYLRSAGYAVVANNWRCRYGEVDLVASTKDGALVFVEVRARSAGTLDRFGAPLESITPRKQTTLRRCAQSYLQRLPSAPAAVRFDCIGVVLGADGEPVSIHHIDNAF